MKLLFVAPFHNITRSWYGQTVQDVMRGRSSNGVVTSATNMSITFPDGGSFHFATVNDRHDVDRLISSRFNAVIEHHHFVGDNLWREVKMNITDNSSGTAPSAELTELRKFRDFAAQSVGSDWPERAIEIVRRARAMPIAGG
jgi:hypothetical protein